MKRLNNVSILNFILSNPISFNLYVFFITFILLLLFKPFTLNLLPFHFLFFTSAYYSTIPVIIYYTIDFLFGAYNEQNKQQITIKMEVIFYFFVLLLLIFIYYYILSIMWPTLFRVPIIFILKSFQYSFTIGIVIIASIKLLDYLFYFKSNYELQVSKDKELLTIVSNTKGVKQYTFHTNAILLINSEKNYICISYFSEEKIKTKKIRITLKEIESLCESLNSNLLFRCHKSYIINKKYIIDIITNSSSSYVKMETNIIVPISPLKVTPFLAFIDSK